MLTELERDLRDLSRLQVARTLVAADDQRVGEWPRELRFYHGTSRANAEAILHDGFQRDFSRDVSCLGRGVYVGRPDKALRFARNKAWHGGDEGALLEVLVSIARPKFVSEDDLGWQAEGYDACRADHTSRSNHMEWCIAAPAACKPTGRLLPVPIDEVPDHNLVETAERVGPAQAPARAREAEEVQEERRTEEIATEIEEIEEIEEVATEQMEISMEVNFPEPISTLSFKLPSWREVEAERAAKKKPLDLFARARAASASTPPSTERPGGAAAGGAATPATTPAAPAATAAGAVPAAGSAAAATEFDGGEVVVDEWAQVGNIHRRIDLKVVPQACLPCALLHFTGSDHLNKRMRLRAGELGYKLSEYQLVKVGPDGKETGAPEPVDSEEGIFKFLGMEYIPPGPARSVEG